MKILNIHGYKGCSENAAGKALKSLGYDVISPDFDYDKISPEETLSILENIIDKEHPEIITGTSYGGFFAAVICARKGIPVILVNPCLMPFLTLPRLGNICDVKEYIPLFAQLSEIKKINVSTIIGGNDEVVDTHDFTENLLYNERFVIYPEGKHSGATLPLKAFFSEILSVQTLDKKLK